MADGHLRVTGAMKKGGESGADSPVGKTKIDLTGAILKISRGWEIMGPVEKISAQKIKGDPIKAGGPILTGLGKASAVKGTLYHFGRRG